MKNLLNKKVIIAYIGSKSTLAKSFSKKYKHIFKFKKYIGDIRDYKKISSWLKKNKDINIFINFAAITSVNICEKFKEKALEVNCKSAVKLLYLLESTKMDNFNYFLSISTSHVFKKTNLKLKENSLKKPTNYYGFTKLCLENFILNNQKQFRYKIGIARIFNYYNGGVKEGFFVNDIIKKLKSKKKIIKFNNVNAYRDFVSMKDINTALLKMINHKLENDYNICSGEKIFLPDIINFLNKKYNKNIQILTNKRNYDLIGSNLKLRKKGWNITNKNFFHELFK